MRAFFEKKRTKKTRKSKKSRASRKSKRSRRYKQRGGSVSWKPQGEGRIGDVDVLHQVTDENKYKDRTMTALTSSY